MISKLQVAGFSSHALAPLMLSLRDGQLRPWLKMHGLRLKGPGLGKAAWAELSIRYGRVVKYRNKGAVVRFELLKGSLSTP
jgi:hypothetical protein